MRNYYSNVPSLASDLSWITESQEGTIKLCLCSKTLAVSLKYLRKDHLFVKYITCCLIFRIKKNHIKSNIWMSLQLKFPLDISAIPNPINSTNNTEN